MRLPRMRNVMAWTLVVLLLIVVALPSIKSKREEAFVEE